MFPPDYRKHGVTIPDVKDEQTTNILSTVVGFIILLGLAYFLTRPNPWAGPQARGNYGQPLEPPRGSWTTGPDVHNGIVQPGGGYGDPPAGSWTTGPDVRNGVVQ
jgi:hypothetical protein